MQADVPAFIHNRAARVYFLPYPGADGRKHVVIRPGLNAPDPAKLEAVGVNTKANPLALYPKDLATVNPCNMHEPDAIELIKITADKRAIDLWLQIDERPVVREALEARARKLTK